MKVSVALATYNGEKYLVDQLDSIKNQTRPVDEVIICDDRSSDNSFEIAKDYIIKNKLEKTWKVTLNEVNKGYAGNFFDAVKMCSGEYVFFCDQDDIWIENRIEKMVSVLDSNNKILMLGSEFTPFYCTEDAPKIAGSVLKEMTGKGDLEHIQLNSKTIFIGSEGCTMGVRREFFNQIEEYWFPGWAHDEFVWKMSLCLDGCYILHEPTLIRRLHSDNVSKRKMRDLDRRISFLAKLNESHLKMYEYARKLQLDEQKMKLISMNIESVELRIQLLDQKKFGNIVKLIFKHFNHYHSRKSIPVELMISLKKVD